MSEDSTLIINQFRSILTYTPTVPQRYGQTDGYPQNSGGIGVGCSFSGKPAISLKRGKIGLRLLLMTNKVAYTRFRFVPKSTTLDDLEGPLSTLFQTCAFFGAHHENLSKDRPTLSATKT